MISTKEVLHTLKFLKADTITLSSGFWAPQASGSVLLTMGDTRILATAVERKEKAPMPFLPLTVDYREHFFAARRIPHTFTKREGKPSQHEVLISRIIDRSIRPCFPKGYCNSVNVNLSLLSIDENVKSDTLSILAASSALIISNIPFNNPVSAVRVARLDGEFVVNPNPEQLQNSSCNIIVGGNQEQILMLQGNADQIEEECLVSLIQVAHEAIQEQCQFQSEFAKKLKIKPTPSDQIFVDEDLSHYIKDNLKDPFANIIRSGIEDKQYRNKCFSEAVELVMERYQKELTPNPTLVEDYVRDVKREVLREFILTEKKRIDGRNPEDIRNIEIRLAQFSAHGDATFSRGLTQVTSTVTLASSLDQQFIDSPSDSRYRHFIVNYNFPGFATNEVKPNRGISRREQGHGDLIENAILSQLPSREENPYTIRITADTLSSDGSSSMAGTCAASLALMDAGVKIKNQVAGIAIGLIYTPEESIILLDISGDEDSCGDADLKITGTAHGITAIQMDIKVKGLPISLLEQMFLKAKEGRNFILSKMNQAINEPRSEYKATAPAMTEIKVSPKMVGALIGSRGKVIQDIQQSTGSEITVLDDGTVTVFSSNRETLNDAIEAVKKVTAEPTLNEQYKGVVKSIQPYGLFVEFLPGKEGLLHVSQIAHNRIENIDERFKLNEVIDVKLISIKNIRGKQEYSLSRKALIIL